MRLLGEGFRTMARPLGMSGGGAAFPARLSAALVKAYWQGSLLDRSGNGKTLSGTGTVDGEGDLNFNGSQSLTAGAAAYWAFLHNGRAYSVYMLVRISAADPNLFQVFADTGGIGGTDTGFAIATEDRTAQIANDRLNYRQRAGGSNIINLYTNSNVLTPQAWHLVTIKFTGAAGDDYTEVRVDGRVEAVNIFKLTSHTSANPTATMNLGQRISAASRLTGEIGALLITEGNPTLAEDNAIEAYFAGLKSITLKADLAPNVTVWADGDYNAFPSLIKVGTDYYLYYRAAASHVGTKGVIKLQISSDGGLTWGAPATVLSDPLYDVRDMLVRQLSTGEFVAVSGRYDPATSSNLDSRVFRSVDGINWGSGISLNSTFTDFTYDSSPPCELPGGDLLAIVRGRDTGDLFDSVRVYHSADKGLTWTEGATVGDGPADSRDYAEPNLLLMADGNVLATIRSQPTEFTFTSISTDGGLTWSVPSSKFRNAASPRTQRFTSGRIVIVGRSGEAFQSERFFIKHSNDNGGTWSTNEYYPSLEIRKFEYGSMVEMSPGVMLVAWAEEISGGGEANMFARSFTEAQISGIP